MNKEAMINEIANAYFEEHRKIPRYKDVDEEVERRTGKRFSPVTLSKYLGPLKKEMEGRLEATPAIEISEVVSPPKMLIQCLETVYSQAIAEIRSEETKKFDALKVLHKDTVAALDSNLHESEEINKAILAEYETMVIANETEKSQLNSIVEKCSCEVEALKKEVNNAKENLAVQNSKFLQLQAEREELRKELRYLQTSYEELLKQVSVLQNCLDQEKQIRTEIEESYKYLDHKHNEVAGRLIESETAIAKERGKFEQASKQLDCAHAEISLQRKKVDEQYQAAVTAITDASNIRIELDKAKNEIVSLKKDLKSTASKLQKRQQQKSKGKIKI